MPNAVYIVIGIVALIVVLGVLAVLLTYFNLWIQAYLSKAKVSIFSIIGMRFRKVNPQVIVINKIKLVKAGIDSIKTDDLEGHYLAGGNVTNVVSAVMRGTRISSSTGALRERSIWRVVISSTR